MRSLLVLINIDDDEEEEELVAAAAAAASVIRHRGAEWKGLFWRVSH